MTRKWKDLALGVAVFACLILLAWLAARSPVVVETPDAAEQMFEAHSAPRSGHWPKVEKDFLETHPTCAICKKKGTKDNPLNVHHVLPFHKNPELELDPSNLITLCRKHHLLFGHLENWSSWNVDVREDCIVWSKKLATRP